MVLRVSIPLFVGSYLQSCGGLPANENGAKSPSNDKVIYYCSMQSKINVIIILFAEIVFVKVPTFLLLYSLKLWAYKVYVFILKDTQPLILK